MITSTPEVIPLSRSKRDISRFLRVSYGIYDSDPNWVAPLLMDVQKVFQDENPLFEHAEMQLWVVSRGGRDVGRIAGILDRSHNRIAGQTEVFFGFFESVNDRAVSDQLFAVVQDWARAKGSRRMLGPMNPTTNDECGLLIEGFDTPPVFMMPYNPEYYAGLVAAAGFTKTKDLLAYLIDMQKVPMDRLCRIASKVRQRNHEITFRPVRRSTLDQDIAKVKEVYNAAWQDNWGFVPMTDAEVDFMAARLKPLLMEGLVWLAEAGNEPIGFLLAVPDFNVALQPLRGRLLTPKLAGFLPYVVGWKRPPRTRVITLGVREAYRSKGLESALLVEGLKVGFEAGFRESEASWILEDNVMMRRVLETIGGKPYKTYRIYERNLS